MTQNIFYTFGFQCRTSQRPHPPDYIVFYFQIDVFIKDHIYLSLWEVFAHSQKFLNSKERRLIHKLSTVALIPFSMDGELLHEWVKVESFSI